jgi:hypothetical protein
MELAERAVPIPDTDEQEVLEAAPPTPENSFGVQRQIERIAALRKLQEQYATQAKEAVAFYEQEAARCEKQAEFLLMSIQAYLQIHNLKEIRTPAGRAHYRKVTHREWPQETELLTFAKAQEREGLYQTKEYPSKKEILSYIKETGVAPEGFVQRSEQKLYVDVTGTETKEVASR